MQVGLPADSRDPLDQRSAFDTALSWMHGSRRAFLEAWTRGTVAAAISSRAADSPYDEMAIGLIPYVGGTRLTPH